MNSKIIFVNATSATVGGSLTILNQFVNNAIEYKNKNKIFYVFVPENCRLKSYDNLFIIPIKAKKYLDRINWDVFGIRKWAKKNKIRPNLIISLQNTAVRFKNVKQIIYLHQPLPYSKESSWNLFKKDERKMWFYKYIYKMVIDLSIDKDDYIIVQTSWMKEALIKDNRYKEENIVVLKPTINTIDIKNIKEINKKDNKKYFFYPAANYKYKNHLIIIEAIKIIKNTKCELLNNIKVVFTLDENSDIYSKVKSNGLEKNFCFLGKISYETVLRYYKTCNIILFPSYIETFGLPLIEAASFGKKIIVSDCHYSKEVLSGYELAKFIRFNNPVEWANEIIESIGVYKEKPMQTTNENGWKRLFDLIDKIIN